MSRDGATGRRTEIGSQAEMSQAVLDRFDRARADGASERTAVIVAAWAWLDRHPHGTIVHATHEVRRFLVQKGRRVSV